MISKIDPINNNIPQNRLIITSILDNMDQQARRVLWALEIGGNNV